MSSVEVWLWLDLEMKFNMLVQFRKEQTKNVTVISARVSCFFLPPYI